MTILSPVSHQIWDMKYRFKEQDGTPIDRTVEDTWWRVATDLASVEDNPYDCEKKFYDIMKDFKFLPAGRILAGAGTNRNVTLFNCYVMGRIPDSMDGIFSALREAALTMQQGGGIGYDFSTLRPKGAPVEGVGSDASGPLSFMDVWDSMCKTIMSAGTRRGAMMGTMRCDHPDISAFINAKRNGDRMRMFNLSVLVTDAFMEAVEDDGPWELKFDGTVYVREPARSLWNQIMNSTYDCAEPGVIFIDRINRENPLSYAETIYATNPCGEQCLPPYGACLLGSINLAKLVENPFGLGPHINLSELDDLTRTAVRMLDNVIDVSKFPLPEQEKEAKAKRRIGLGVTGLADALIMCGERYGSDLSIELVKDWMWTIQNAAYLASADLAAEKGSFPLFDADKYLASPHMRSVGQQARKAISKHGLRNSHLTSIAPTGTISVFAENVSSGIEPAFAWSYKRNVLMPDGSKEEHQVRDYAYRYFKDFHDSGDEPLPNYFVDAAAISPRDHVVMQATVQKYVDSSISKTINVPAETDFDAFKDVYQIAYDLGCKGCTTYRPNDVTGAVLEREEKPEIAEGPLVPGKIQDRDHTWDAPPERPDDMPGKTYKIRWPESDHAIYITINDLIDGGQRRPFEIFINSKNMENYAWTVALTRMVSAVFRRGGDIAFVVEELKAVFDPRGGQWVGKRYVPSLLAMIGETIEQHMKALGFIPDYEDLPDFSEVDEPANGIHSGVVFAKACSKCNMPTLTHQEGCETCLSCGYSKCA